MRNFDIVTPIRVENIPLSPVRLVGSGLWLPVREHRVPLMIFGQTFERETPTIRSVNEMSEAAIEAFGADAVELSLKEPFGFKAALGGKDSIVVSSQMTEALIIAPLLDDPNKLSWLVTVATKRELTKDDETLFARGAALIGSTAIGILSDRDS